MNGLLHRSMTNNGWCLELLRRILRLRIISGGLRRNVASAASVSGTLTVRLNTTVHSQLLATVLEQGTPIGDVIGTLVALTRSSSIVMFFQSRAKS